MGSKKTIGIIGGGQLGRMLTLAALPLGFRVIVIDPSENCPAEQVGATQITANLRDKKAIRKLARLADYITIEIEHLDTDVLEDLARKGARVNPYPSTIKLIQDKLKQKEFLQNKGFSVAPFKAVDNVDQAFEAFNEWEGTMILKTRHNAYDGRGNAVIKSVKDLKKTMEQFKNMPLYAEKIISFEKELAVIVAKDYKGNLKAYPIAETVHKRNICVEVTAPAKLTKNIEKKAVETALNAVGKLKGAGVFGVELFLANGQCLINEIAPRVHNSGHFTMDACATSQFEQHIRAISELPLGNTAMVVPAVSMINILGEHNRPTKISGLATALADPQVHVHVYGKSPTKIDRKMGHINALGGTIQEALKAAQTARKHISI